MKKKKSLVAIVAILLIVGIGVTFAYYSSNDRFTNIFNAGLYRIIDKEVFVSPDNWIPGETIPKVVTSKNTGSVDAAVRISYSEKWEDHEGNDISSQITPNPAIINFDNQSDWTLNNGYYYYKYILKPNDETSSFISGVTLDPNLDSVTCTGEGSEKTCEAINKASGAIYKLKISIDTVQYDQYQNVWNTNVEIIEKTESIIKYLSRQVAGQITPGDLIGIGESEDFYVVSSNSEKTVLLAKYNLLVGNYYDEEDSELKPLNPLTTPGYGLQSVDALVSYAGEITVGAVKFSSENTYPSYWLDEDEESGELFLKDEYSENDTIYFDSHSYKFKYTSNNEVAYPYVYDNAYITAPDFENDGWGTEGYSIAYYVEEYVNRLKEMGSPNTITGRLLSYEEAGNAKLIEDNGTSIIDVENQDFWLGSVLGTSSYDALCVIGGLPTNSTYAIYYDYGVRPVIEIPTSELQ